MAKGHKKRVSKASKTAPQAPQPKSRRIDPRPKIQSLKNEGLDKTNLPEHVDILASRTAQPSSKGASDRYNAISKIPVPTKGRKLTALQVTFLGTASARPSCTRNNSSLALHLGGDVWLFDCGEGTLKQLQRSRVKMGKIEKVFITHTHGDHIFGLVPLMATLLNSMGSVEAGREDPRLSVDTTKAALEIYGPLGTRAYVRNGLAYTHTDLGASYVVHELRFPNDPPSGDHTALAPPVSECSFGRNIAIGDDGCWRDIYKDNTISVSAAPIYHTVPCVGFVVTEAPACGRIDMAKYKPHLQRTQTPMSVMNTLKGGGSVTLNDGTILQGPPRRPGRKIVILGDTHDPLPMVPICEDADLLIHEATNAHLPGIDTNTKNSDTYESVEERTKSRGHSTPQMAGAFAKRIRARRLILNHFSARYSGDKSRLSKKIMDAIGQLAEKEFGKEVLCATDLMSVDVSFDEK